MNFPVLEYESNPSATDLDMIKNGVLRAAEQAGMGPTLPFAFFLRDDERSIVGGAFGHTMYGMIYTDYLWVDPSYRNRGHATQILQAIENLGRSRGCTFATLLTLSWEALPLYLKLGYQIEFERRGFEHNAIMYYLRKDLSLA
jgi:GNAT superfamily N-acetyltransferase